ncbi:TetR/AcrR family transcriptional regulator [Paraburkholderia dinghuensis]|uniref:TetR/AcrR family transcriptional regulator n=1 Tax=Paraburkholderia dinghuensis TaxID=2305225 RepID=A0A3N6MU13_9BURK|nr:TetR/AcrR family transcriptional regulator [Paraburkholderia dinghuensis]
MGIPDQKGSSNAVQQPALRQALRARILDAARRIVTRDGFTSLSMRKIADAIGYSPASIYLYFENRDEIARALGHEGHAQLLAQLEPLVLIADPRERLRALAQTYVAFGRAHPQTYRAVFIDVPGAADPGGQIVALFADALDAVHGADGAARAEAFWATLHGMVALSLTCPGFPRSPLGQVVDAALDAWSGAQAGAPTDAGTCVAKRTKASTT